ncbi:glycogen synthase [Deinococcus metallilatus]|uniref:Glycogen synthase n=1 Tax=Deinococcus metallilatus TaxID=1211322 RepID=A0AAJ5K007_9DEIO|nr:glycogen/starch synthase [Deinococcus metallilatus]MBB5295507.1 starch synthase [Deinococcus metallilatus]QBY07978.1 glycogen synthase [Deinococcus metallilatus]RXJ12871.1 glycogen synthase [Deinococcus metallilatus]TLK27207.1 glycogen synthase [Deinococcus metallilatus]
MQVLHVASEVFPFSRSGGLGDVLGALPAVQARLGADVTVVSPWYASLSGTPQEVWRGEVPGAGLVWAGEVREEGVRFLFVGLPAFERPGLYHPDDVERFCAFGRAVLPVLEALEITPDVLHGHDWQAGLVVAYAHLAGWRAAFTIHNLQYQGRWNLAEAREWTGLPDWTFGPEGVEFYGDLNLMKAGLVFAEQITTVSPTYAREITTPQYGEGLEGLLVRLTLEGRLSGILNGLDQERWDPRTDPDIRPYADAAGKAANAAVLRAEFGLDDAPILGVVSRLADQKGMDLLIMALPELVERWNVVVLGGGDPLLAAALIGWAFHPRVAFASGLNEPLAHRVYAGADAFAMPSRFEPCGLSQMIAMRYGTLPVVRETGGLVDTVPPNVGFRFADAAPGALAAACRQARAVFGDQVEWQARMARGMELNFSWEGPARQYLALYRSL